MNHQAITHLENVLESATARPWHIVERVDLQSGPQGALLYVSTAGARGRLLNEAIANARLVRLSVNTFAALTQAVSASAFALTTGDVPDSKRALAACEKAWQLIQEDSQL